MKKAVSLLLCAVVLIGLLSVSALAADGNRIVITADKTEAYPGEQVVLDITMESVDACDTFGLMLEFDREVFELVRGSCSVSYLNEYEEELVATKTFNKETGKEGVAVAFYEPVVYNGKVAKVFLKVKDVVDLTNTVFTAKASALNGYDEVVFAVESVGLTAIPAPAEPSVPVEEPSVPATTEPTTPPATEPSVPEGVAPNQFTIVADKTDVFPGDKITFNITTEMTEASDSFGLKLVFDREVFTFVRGAVTASYVNEYDENQIAVKTFNKKDGLEGIAISFYEPLVYSGKVGNFTLQVNEGVEFDASVVTCEVVVKKSAEELAADISEVEITKHVHNYVQYEAQAPTCDSVGWEAYQACNCGDTTYVELPATGHAWVGHEAVAPTCTTDGNIAYQQCATCGAAQTWEENPMPLGKFGWVQVATGHTLEHHDAVEPTCVDNGHEAFDYCSACECFFYEDPLKLSYQDGVILALGHTWVGYEAVAPTCTTDGNIAYQQCSVCGAAQTWEENPMPLGKFGWVQVATGHTLEHHDAVEPTCIDNGHEAFDYCTVCACFFYEDPLKLSYQDGVILATGHEWVNHEAVAPTCEFDGNIAYQQCATCGAAQTWEENPMPLGKFGWVVGATGHEWVGYEAVAPTCDTEGNIAYQQCATCGAAQTWEENPKPLSRFGWVVGATGHDWINHEEVKPGCETEGSMAYQQCATCGAAQTWEEEPKPLSKFGWIVGATGHAFEEGKCVNCGFKAGDIDGDDQVNNDDVVALLWYTLFPEDYDVAAGADTNNDGAVDNDDVVNLLWHTLFPEEYPLYVAPATKKYL